MENILISLQVGKNTSLKAFTLLIALSNYLSILLLETYFDRHYLVVTF
uniref:Uncharacterized protein n=1 Tax=Rhizophora mucronata TaxID=61149 RepID=A0A2P2PMZ2_RHIMU